MHEKDVTLKFLQREGSCVTIALLLPMIRRLVVKAFLICLTRELMETIVGSCFTAMFAIATAWYYAVLLSNLTYVLQEMRLLLLLRAIKSLKILIVRF